MSEKYTNPPNRFIETHTHTLTNLLAFLLSFGGWFLWNIILSFTYKSPTTIYFVRSTFLLSFGRSLHWWLVLLLILLAIAVFEISTLVLRKIVLPQDEDAFQQLEKDPDVKRRFEEASAGELQAGWNRAKDEEERVRETVEKVVARDRERRELEVAEMVRRRGNEEERGGSVAAGGDVDRVLSRGFGDVRVC
jgi:phospholipid-translocating ATPase